jgi:superfamily I DNA/RNA helicase
VIGTIHSIKGGEADCVYVMPDLSPQGAAQWQGDDDDKAAVIRTFYVAMTRARHKLALLLPMSRLSVGRLVPDALTTAPF